MIPADMPPRFFAATDQFDENGKPYQELLRVWPNYGGAYPELYTEFMSVKESQARESRAREEGRAHGELIGKERAAVEYWEHKVADNREFPGLQKFAIDCLADAKNRLDKLLGAAASRSGEGEK